MRKPARNRFAVAIVALVIAALAIISTGQQTSNPSSALHPVYVTNSGTQTGTFGPITMVATSPAQTTWYRVSFYVENVAVGTSCTGNSLIAPQVGFQGPNEGSSANIPVGTCSITTNGTAGKPAQCGGGALGQGSGSYVFPVAASTAVTYTVVFTGGTSCSPAPTFSVTPLLEQM